MFGTYSTLLAVMVIFLYLGGMPVLGGYAVFGFYILSGYLMTLIMQKNYSYDRGGVARYAVNRLLRIYPVYWMSCLINKRSLPLISRKIDKALGDYSYPVYLVHYQVGR